MKKLLELDMQDVEAMLEMLREYRGMVADGDYMNFNATEQQAELVNADELIQKIERQTFA